VAPSLSRFASATAVIVCVGCDHPPAAPERRTVDYATPIVQGLVRETNGGPIAGASIVLSARTGGAVIKAESNGAGGFVLPPSAELCQSAHTVFLAASKGEFRFPEPQPIICTAVSDSAAVAVEVKAERYLIVSRGSAAEFTLSNDDLNWRDEDYGGYSCGPCRNVGLTSPVREGMTVRVERSGIDPIRVWVESENYGDLERLAEFSLSGAESGLTLPISAAWTGLYLQLKIGLPPGGRFPAASPPIAVRVAVME
jgi:hypothetical protein